MTIFICDKCGEEMSRDSAFLIQIGDYVYHRTVQGQQFELCHSCAEKLLIFLKPEKQA